jgi:UDP-glucuronate decarboxylase
MKTTNDFIGPVNIGNPVEFSMLELAENILAITGSKSKLIFNPLPQDDPKQRQPDISLAYSKLDSWKPAVKLDEGLKKTIKYFESLIDIKGNGY